MSKSFKLIRKLIRNTHTSHISEKERNNYFNLLRTDFLPLHWPTWWRDNSVVSSEHIWPSQLRPINRLFLHRLPITTTSKVILDKQDIDSHSNVQVLRNVLRTSVTTTERSLHNILTNLKSTYSFSSLLVLF